MAGGYAAARRRRWRQELGTDSTDGARVGVSWSALIRNAVGASVQMIHGQLNSPATTANEGVWQCQPKSDPAGQGGF